MKFRRGLPPNIEAIEAIRAYLDLSPTMFFCTAGNESIEQFFAMGEAPEHVICPDHGSPAKRQPLAWRSRPWWADTTRPIARPSEHLCLAGITAPVVAMTTKARKTPATRSHTKAAYVTPR